MEKFVDSKILSEIKAKSEELQNRVKNGGDILAVARGHKKALQQEAIYNSYRIEYPDEGSEVSTTGTRTLKKKHMTGLEDLEVSFRWGYDQIRDSDQLNHSIIKGVAGRIDPEFHGWDSPPYRRDQVRITDANWMPPRAEKVSRELENFFDQMHSFLKFDGLRAGLEAAAHAHIHLVRIHPFADTNGRTARNVQNIILKKYGLLPPVIHFGERFDYYRQLEGAVIGYNNRVSVDDAPKTAFQGEKNFHDYLAGRVSISFDRLLSNL